MIEELVAVAVRSHAANLSQFALEDGAINYVGSGLRAADIHAGLQPGEEVQPASAAIPEGVHGGDHLPLHGDGNVDIGGRAGNHAMESRGRHPDHHHGVPVQDHGLIENGAIVGETAGPVAVAQHGDRMRARGTVVIRRQYPAHDGGHSQRLEEIPGDQFRARRFSVALPRQAGGRAHAGDQGCEGGVAVAQIAVHGIGENGFVIIAGTRSRSGVIGMQQHQPLRIPYRQRAQHHLVQQRKNGGIGANAQRQREHGGGGKQRAAPQRPERVGDVFQHLEIRRRGVTFRVCEFGCRRSTFISGAPIVAAIYLYLPVMPFQRTLTGSRKALIPRHIFTLVPATSFHFTGTSMDL